MVRLQDEAIDVAALCSGLRRDADGAVALFVGTVRDHNRGRRVLHLVYSAYREMALAEMARVEARARERFAVGSLALVHRLGRLEVGEASVAVAVAAPHRAPALECCRFVIDALKRSVPIWKKECFDGGEVWIEGAGESPAQPKSSSSRSSSSRPT